ncbi:intracellular protein transport protein USO1 isoform X2 [Octopus sinensis]|uniref:Intracellular protein transport protein USO1 isoform X2 n=1 Tax=Octopus sinensis TaxID=2607531 RepID=A0A7E6FPP0_9MOLL|nr:intracellular protein transport protein USO1 isoform X2 [Octopus sinensis]
MSDSIPPMDDSSHSQPEEHGSLGEVHEKVAPAGHDVDNPNQECLLYLWTLYKQTEDEKVQMEDSHRREMEEVDQYVEHIQQLSEDGEITLQTLEFENKQLNDRITQLVDSQSSVQKELRKMLEDADLHTILDLKCQDQFAYLLAERAELQTKVKSKIQTETLEVPMTAIVNKASTCNGNISKDAEIEGRDSVVTVAETAEPVKASAAAVATAAIAATPVASLKTTDISIQVEMKFQEQLETDFDEELQKIHEKWQMSEKRMKDKYEEEVNTVLEENERMDEELTELKIKVDQSEKVIESLQKELASYQNSNLLEEDNVTTPTKRRSCDVALRKVIENKTKVETELVSLKMQVRNLEYDNKNLKSQLEQVQQKAELERDHQQQMRYKTTSLRSEMDNMEQKLEDHQKSSEKLLRERDASHAQVELLKKELKDMRVQKEQLETWQDIAEIMSNDKKNLMEKVELLNAEVKEIQAKRDEIIKEKLQLSEEEMVLTNQLEEFRREIEEQKSDYNKVKNDYERLKCSKLEQSARIDDLQTSVNKVTKEKEQLEDQLEKANEYSESLKGTVEELNGDIAKYKMEKEEEGKQQQVVTAQLQEQNEALGEQHNSLKQELQNQQLKTDELLEGQHQLLSKHEEMCNSLAAEIDDLKSKLKLTLEELGRARSLLDEKTEKCAAVLDLETQLEETESQLVTVTHQYEMSQVEIEELKKETANLKTKLANAHTEIQDISQEYEVKQEESQEKLNTVEHNLQNEIKDMLEEKSNLERDYNAKLTKLQMEVVDFNNKLQSRLTEKNDLEEKLDKVQIDLKNTENQLLEANSVKEDLSKRLEIVSASKEDISEKLAFALQKLEEVSQSRYWNQSKQSVQLEASSEVDGGKPQDIPLAVVEPDNYQSDNFGTLSPSHSIKTAHKSGEDEGSEDEEGEKEDEEGNKRDAKDSGECEMEQSTCLSERNQRPLLIENTSDEFVICLDAMVRGSTKGVQISKSFQRRMEQLKNSINGLDAKGKGSGILERFYNVMDLFVDLQDNHSQLYQQINKLMHYAKERKHGIEPAVTQSHVSALAQERNSDDERSQTASEVKLGVSQNQNLSESSHNEERISSSCQNEIQKDNQVQLENLQMVLKENCMLRQQLEAKQKAYDKLSTLLGKSLSLENGGQIFPENLDQCDQYEDEVQSLVPQLNGKEDKLEDLRKVKTILVRAGKEMKLYKQRLEEEKIKNKQLLQYQNQLKQEMQKMQKGMIYNAWQQNGSNQSNNNNKCDINCANSDTHQLHKEVTDLKMALFAANERQEILQRKYEDRKLRIRAKFLRARQLHNQEKMLMKEQLRHLGEDLLVTRSMFNKEHELREEREASYKKLASERRELFSKSGEQVEIIRELTRSQSRLEVQSKFLEEENKRLQEKLIAANHRQSLSQRANHNLIYPHQLTSPKSLEFDSIFERPLSHSNKGTLPDTKPSFQTNISHIRQIELKQMEDEYDI